MTKYRISNRETLLHGGTIIPAGSPLPAGIFNQKQIDEHVRTGFLVAIGSERDNNKRDVGVALGTVPLRTNITDDNRVLRATDPNAPKTSKKGRWAFDPNQLKPLTLEELNLKIAGIDHNIAPFDTEAEAIAQLSQDFRA